MSLVKWVLSIPTVRVVIGSALSVVVALALLVEVTLQWEHVLCTFYTV